MNVRQTVRVEEAKVKDLCYVSELVRDSELIFCGSGDWHSWLRSTATVPVCSLGLEWRKLNCPDDHVLVVEVAQIKGIRSTGVTFRSMKPAEEDEHHKEAFEVNNPFLLFDSICAWGFQDMIDVDKYLKSRAKNWSRVCIPAGTIVSATTLEDIARYVLGLEKGYTRHDLDWAAKPLLFEWDPRNIEDARRKAFAELVSAVVKKSAQILLQALKDKKA